MGIAKVQGGEKDNGKGEMQAHTSVNHLNSECNMASLPQTVQN
jgi:hypothetical protein